MDINNGGLLYFSTCVSAPTRGKEKIVSISRCIGLRDLSRIMRNSAVINP